MAYPCHFLSTKLTAVLISSLPYPFPFLVSFYFYFINLYYFVLFNIDTGIGAQTHKTEKALKKGMKGLRKNFTDLADLAIAEFDEADLSPQVKGEERRGGALMI
jgi:hypothetical protein